MEATAREDGPSRPAVNYRNVTTFLEEYLGVEDAYMSDSLDKDLDLSGADILALLFDLNKHFGLEISRKSFARAMMSRATVQDVLDACGRDVLARKDFSDLDDHKSDESLKASFVGSPGVSFNYDPGTVGRLTEVLHN